ncbi:MAG: tetratricopeptide repeat protein [Candidatus Hermodarchaeota archaeon]
MAEELSSDIYESCDLDIKQIFMSGEPLTFLVGAGISIEPPSGLMSAWQIMKAIIRFGASEEAVQKLLDIKNLRFEFLIEQFQDSYDEELRFLNYFEAAIQPNLIHHFLAQMAQAGQYLMTTNFDTLIECAIGLNQDALRIVITRKDFETYSDPQEMTKTGLLPIYKLHGSLRNAKTGEDTRESIIITLDALGKHKEGEIFSVETFKRSLFKRVCQGRTLVIMGYSGGDDFDIIPSLLTMQDIKRVVWISHIDREDSSIEIHQFSSKADLLPDKIAALSREDKILYDIRRLKSIDVIRVVTYTASFIADVLDVSYDKSSPDFCHDAYQWLVKHFPSPSEEDKAFFTGMIFITYGFFSDALKYLQQAYEIDKRLKNLIKMSMDLTNIGFIYNELGEHQKALEHHQQAYEILEQLGDLNGMAMNLCNMGLVYAELGEHQKALEHFQQAYEIQERLGNLVGMASDLGNLGNSYYTIGELQKALEHYQQAYTLHERLGNLAGMAKDFCNLGEIYYDMNELQNALKHHQQAYEIDERLGNLVGMARHLGNLGVIYRDLKESQKALKHHQQAYEIDERLGNLVGMARHLGNLGIVYSDLEEYQKALEHDQQAYDLHKRLGNLDEMASTLSDLGVDYSDLEEFQKALEHYQKAYELHERLGDLNGMAYDLSNIGDINADLKEHQKALEYYKKAYEIFKQLGDPQDIKEVLQDIERMKKQIKEEK